VSFVIDECHAGNRPRRFRNRNCHRDGAGPLGGGPGCEGPRPAHICRSVRLDAILAAVFKLGEISFGDNVSVVDAPPTRQSGHANLVGVCYGMTTPSVTDVEVIGDAVDDVALNVHFENDAVPDAWFAPQLVTLVDHAVGSHATVGDRSFVKTADGAWVPTQSNGRRRVARRSWFRRT
jgi:hypothetical protein